MTKWIASQYLDNDQWGIVTESIGQENNEIVVGVSSRLTEKHARIIATAPDGVELARLVVEQFGTVAWQSEPAYLIAARSILARVDGAE